MLAADAFARAFGERPSTTASAPARVNLIGEHVDYNGGFVLPAGLQRRVDVAFAPDDAPIAHIHSPRFSTTVTRPLSEQKRGDWSDHALGALAACRDHGWLNGGAKIAITSDAPDGAGVSSSAALITAILRSVSAAAGEEPDAVALATRARAVENEYVGVPCGIMDQMAVGLADERHALFLDTIDLTYEVLRIPEDWGFAVLHSGIRRELSDGRYEARFQECHDAAQRLRAPWLCRLTPDQEAAATHLPPPLSARVRHVVSEHKRTAAAAQAMIANDITAFAALMNESHASYSADFDASTPEVDHLVADALETGALGARLTGGGFGGAIVALSPKRDLNDWLARFLPRHPNAWRI